MTYFSFTSLATVGFGDYVPISNGERLFIALVLLFGVSMFSYIMGIFIQILNEFQGLRRPDFEESDNLAKFLSVFKRYNNNIDLKATVCTKIENFFYYKWKNDKGIALRTFEGSILLHQLPFNVQNCIY